MTDTFYALSNQTCFDAEEVDWTSFHAEIVSMPGYRLRTSRSQNAATAEELSPRICIALSPAWQKASAFLYLNWARLPFGT